MDEDKDVKPEAALANSFTSPIARPSLYSLEDDAWKTAEDLPTMGRMSGSMLPGLVGRVSLSQAD